MLTRRHALLALSAASCARKSEDMNSLAERYVKLILAIGHHDPNYVDAYYGPAEWKPAKQPIENLATEASALLDAIGQLTGGDMARQNFLLTQTRAAAARISLLRGEKLSFDKEAKALYDVKPVAPRSKRRSPVTAPSKTATPNSTPASPFQPTVSTGPSKPPSPRPAPERKSGSPTFPPTRPSRSSM